MADTRFAIINSNSRIWAFSSIHSDFKRLNILHEIIAGAVCAGDYFVYMGNIVGVKEGAKETFAEILDFKQKIQTQFPDITDEHFIFLRGIQEEMWQKLMYIHLSHKDDKVFNFISDKGVDGVLKSYGFNPMDGFDLIEKGAVAASRWTEKIREVFYKDIAYEKVFLNLKHAAYTDDNAILFVNSGINHKKKLTDNKDEFWWAGNYFIQDKPYQDFNVVVRGYSPSDESGIFEKEHYITVNNKPSLGYAEPLYALFFNENHTLDKAIEV